MKIGFYNIQGGTGKTTIAINFAYLLSQSIKTVLIDCDFFGGTVSLAFNLENESEDYNILRYLAGEIELEDTLLQYEDLSIILSGIGSNVFNYDIDFEKLADLINFLDEEYDVIIVDLPPNLNENNIILYNEEYKFLNSTIIVSEDSIPSITNSLKTMDLLSQLKIPYEGIIINKSQGLVDLTDIEEDILGVLSFDPYVERQWSEGIPIAKIKTQFSKEFKKLTDKLAVEYLQKDLASLRALKLAKDIYGLEEEGEE